MNYSIITDRIATTGLYMFMIFAWIGPALAYIGMTLMLIAFLFNIKVIWPTIRRDPMFILAIISTLWMLYWGWHTAQEFPETRTIQVDATRSWVFMWLFLLVAWWLKGNLRRIQTVLVLAFISMTISILIDIDWQHLDGFVHKRIKGFHVQVDLLGLFIAVAILGMYLLAKHFWGDSNRKIIYYIRIFLWFAIMAFLLEIFILTYARAAWMAALLVFSVAMLLALKFWLMVESHKVFLKHLAIITMLVIILASVLGVMNKSQIIKRLTNADTTLDALVTKGIEKVPLTSLGMRLHLYALAIKLWKDRPLLGWGPGNSQFLIAKGVSEKQKNRHHPHFHNSYLEVLVSFGLVGFLGLCMVIWLLASVLRKAFLEGNLTVELFLIISGSLSMLGIWTLSDFFIMSTNARFFWFLLAGSAYTFAFSRQSSEKQNKFVKQMVY